MTETGGCPRLMAPATSKAQREESHDEGAEEMLVAPRELTNRSISEPLQRGCAASRRQSTLIVTPSSGILGATVEGLDLSAPLAQQDFDAVLRALGQHAVIRFPRQRLTARELAEFSGRFGELEINVANAYQEPGLPQVMILSNIVENGKPIGLADAGQGWHTDMSYSRMIAFANVLYGIQIPHRDGVPLGATEFSDMRAAYDDLPDDLKRRLDGMTALHDFNKFWEMMRREKGSQRPPLTEAQRKAKPPTSHPVFLVHPLTGRKLLYANPGYTVRINELSERGKRRDPRVPVRSSAAAEVSLRAPLANRRCPGVGRSVDHPPGGGGLWPRRASSHQALPGDGDAVFQRSMTLLSRRRRHA